MLDLIAKNEDAFDISNLSSIIVDEADEIIQPPKKVMTTKIHHRTPGEILLDWIFQKRSVSTSQEFMKFIAISATLSTYFQEFITEKGWVSEQFNSGGLRSSSAVHPTPSTTDHHVVLVSLNKSPDPTIQPDRIRIHPARLPHATLQDNVRLKPPLAKDVEPPSSTDYPPNYLAIPALQRILRETSTKKALAIIPHGASKADFVWACHYFGLVGAQELRFSSTEDSLEPRTGKGDDSIVYVSFLKEVRGLDLKNVEIVFIMGEFGTVEDYVHITGRTGRRRRTHGTVITILEETSENLGQKLLNSAIKLVRTGAKFGDWSLPTIEMDLKALPGDEYEEIRNKAGIVTVTEEVRKKEERERRTSEERKRWLLMQGVGEEDVSWISVENVGDEVERPESFGMVRSVTRERKIEMIAADPISTDWKEVLAQSLRESSDGKPTSEENVIFGGLYPTESEAPPEEIIERQKTKQVEEQTKLEDEDEDEDLATEDTVRTNDPEPLPPFPSKPPFPREQYRAAWKNVKSYYDKIRDEGSPSSETAVSNSESPPILLESLLPNKTVLRQSTPILPQDISLIPGSNQDVFQHVIEGETLRQLEESNLLAPKKPSRKKAKKKEDSELKKTKRGRPRKNNTNVGA
jgi:superfamily II DNA/RNA helicase